MVADEIDSPEPRLATIPVFAAGMASCWIVSPAAFNWSDLPVVVYEGVKNQDSLGFCVEFFSGNKK